MLTIKQAAEYTGLSTSWISMLCQEGKIKARKEQIQPHVKVKRQWIMEKEDLDAFLAGREKPEIDIHAYDLTDEEKQILVLRKDRTFAQVGKILGVSRQRVHQIEKRALERIGA